MSFIGGYQRAAEPFFPLGAALKRNDGRTYGSSCHVAVRGSKDYHLSREIIIG